MAHSTTRNESGVLTAYRGETGQWTCQQLCVDSRRCISLSGANHSAGGKIPEAAEFITRANYGLTIGNFELDFDDGEVRYKTSLDVEGTALTHSLCRQIVVANVFIMDRYLPGLMAVISGAQTPAQAVANIEGH